MNLYFFTFTSLEEDHIYPMRQAMRVIDVSPGTQVDTASYRKGFNDAISSVNEILEKGKIKKNSKIGAITHFRKS